METFLRNYEEYIHLVMVMDQFSFERYKLKLHATSLDDHTYERLNTALVNYEREHSRDEDFFTPLWSRSLSSKGDEAGYDYQYLIQYTPWSMIILNLKRLVSDFQNKPEDEKLMNEINNHILSLCRCFEYSNLERVNCEILNKNLSVK